MSESLQTIGRFAVTQAQIRTRGERVVIGDYQSAAQHLNDVLTEWAASSMVVPGFYRKAYTIAERKSVFTLGVDADLPTSQRVTEVKNVVFRPAGSFQYIMSRVEVDKVFPTGYDRGVWYMGSNSSVYGLSFDNDAARLVFPGNLRPADVLVVDYRSELGAIDVDAVTDESISQILVNLPNLHLVGLRYGVAARMAQEYGSPMAATLMNNYRHKLTLLLKTNREPLRQKMDPAILPASPFYLRDTGSPITEIGGMYQSDGTVILDNTHPHHPGFEDTLRYGLVSSTGVETPEGGAQFMYGTPVEVVIAGPSQAGAFMYLEAPEGGEITSIVDERGTDVIRGWDRMGQQWRIGPLSAAVVNRSRTYRVLLVRE